MSKNIKGVIPKWRFPEFHLTNGWYEKKIGQLLRIGNGRDYKHLSKGNIPVYGSGGYMLSVNDYLYDGDSVCIGRKGTINNPFFLRGKFWTVDTLFYTHSYKNCIPLFIYSVFQKINWLKYSEASGVPSLSKTTIEKINIFVPQEEEQKKIADCLSSIDYLISAEEKKLSLLNDYKKGWLQKLFPSEGKTVPEWRFPEFRDSGDWENTTIEKIADYENGKAHENNIIDNGKYIVVNSKFISTEGEIIKYTNEANLLAYKGDILMVLSDVPNGRALSKCYLVEKDNVYTVNQRVCRIIPEKVNSTLLFYTINRNKYFLSFDDGVKQTNLKKNDVLSCSIVIPKEPDEQEKIADFLSGIDELISSQKEKIEKLKQHKIALMQGLFPAVEEVL